MGKKLKVGVFFGGKSAEHEISINSARSIIKNLNRDKYNVVAIAVDREGRFYTNKSAILKHMPVAGDMLVETAEIAEADSVNIVNICKQIDVAFPVLHGPFGEDGCIQGIFRYFNVPFSGPDVLGSAVAMDKDIAKRLLVSAGIPTARNAVFYRHERALIDYERLCLELGPILFVKPANLGSSVGISKVKSPEDFVSALEEAFLYDNKILVEEFIKAREIECAVLGNEDPKASMLGEIMVNSSFYSYSAKYCDKDGAKMIIPAQLPADVSDNIRQLAIKIFRTLCCEGMARVDFFITDDFRVFVNEINTIPGFTDESSMYPKLWEASGLSYEKLLDNLLELAMARHTRNAKLRAIPKITA
ncbi:MAG: D-alanine--D-alanine ligase [Holosporaceae bacterium]|jgi:D-alanine-D-alanine ligase|nr:D-alanine--D-alanine ligase [Holosporaceae bacterium]